MRTTVFDGPVVVVGAGVTGMVLAQLLAEAGAEVVVVERNETVGGLAGSFRYGDFVFDVGPHRFHTANPVVRTWLDRMLGPDGVSFPRRSEVYLRGTYYRWPLQPSQLMQLPPAMAVQSGLDLFLNTFRQYDVESFESYILRQYGPTLYAHFFRDYTEDFLGLHPRDTHPDWAKAGINRAIIDDKLQMQNLSQLLKSTLLHAGKKEMDFLYPSGGMDTIWHKVRASIEALGGRFILGRSAELEGDGQRVRAVRAGEERIKAGLVIWTGPIEQAARALGLGPSNLRYRALLLYNVMAEADTEHRYQWCYYGEREIVFSRVSIPRFFDERTCPPGTLGLCVEVPCMEGDDRWRHGERLTDWVVDDLVRVDMLPGREAVRDVRLERVPESYPIYHLHYPRDLERAQQVFAGVENLRMAGRTGTFWYNNMDHCVEAVLTLVQRLLREAGRHMGEEQLAAGPGGEVEAAG